MRRAPDNTSGEEGGLFVFAHALGTGDVGEAIQMQEADGQRGLVTSNTMPTECNYYGSLSAEEMLRGMGIKVLGPVQGDPLFQYVELPPGWAKVATPHAMWSDLLDNKGRKRASIFYKAAFYDRGAHWDPILRYSYGLDYDKEKSGVAVAVVKDSGEVIFSTEPIPLPEGREKYEIERQAKETAKSWLAEHFPDWENPGAYWEE